MEPNNFDDFPAEIKDHHCPHTWVRLGPDAGYEHQCYKCGIISGPSGIAEILISQRRAMLEELKLYAKNSDSQWVKVV